ncbi:MlaA family lipoprotein [Candidatus Enterovibrio altilux]|uniref:Lipoprotein n=1 Tax=Candidatus Enterovibrio altilux TaxID=1927128 RepID=A0A291B7G9_9GAMM|nr:MlaA family lipoprotein [Candidatus Enterovibrio luxaltus]ATF08927.1 Lipoprotein [Candidatus Enterovibrio luxaltus]
MWKDLIFVFCLAVGLSGCAQSPEKLTTDDETNVKIRWTHTSDPFEGFNRAMWVINYEYFDPYVGRPLSVAYVNYMPSWTRTGISNFISNLEEPASIFSSLLMFENKDALGHFNRFWLNTIFGVAGLIDIATTVNIPKLSDRQFGDAMGYYNIGQGPYMMVPVYGPITVRDGVGAAVDILYPPMSLLTITQSIIKWTLDGMESRAVLIKQEEILKNSPDLYALIRDAYLQNKAFKARNGEVHADEDEDFEAFMDEIDGD